MAAGARWTCLDTFERWQLRQCWAYCRTNFRMPGQQNLLETRRTVASTPGWVTPWREATAALRNRGGTSGRNTPVEILPERRPPCTDWEVTKSDVLSHIRLQSVQVS